MNDQNKLAILGLVNSLNSNMDGLKLVMRNAFKTIYSDKWKQEEEQFDAISRDILTGHKNGDSNRVSNAIKNLKTFLMMDSNGNSTKLSDVNLRSYMSNSNGRYYGPNFVEFINLLKKVDLDATGSMQSNAPVAKPPVSSTYTESYNNSETSNSNNKSSNMIIIEHPLTGEKLQVANKKFEYGLKWHEAKKACKELGNGWRLPSIDELKAMYQQLYLKGEGNFVEQRSKNAGIQFWSSTEYDSTSALMYYFDISIDDDRFDDKKTSDCDKECNSDVRAVRSL
jgi:hypothetical protein